MTWQWAESLGRKAAMSQLPPGPPYHYEFAKRTFDLLVSGVLLVLLAPMLIVIALLVRFDSPGPALFIQKRVGKNGIAFPIYKFRSMHTHAARYRRSPTSPSDARITRAGRLLRKTSLDELPQLLNVFLGTMSLVGPRPEMPYIVERYNVHQRQRLQVRPGMTGVWQLSSARAFPIHDHLHYDLWYIRNRRFCLDLEIILRTLFALRGAI